MIKWLKITSIIIKQACTLNIKVQNLNQQQEDSKCYAFIKAIGLQIDIVEINYILLLYMCSILHQKVPCCF